MPKKSLLCAAVIILCMGFNSLSASATDDEPAKQNIDTASLYSGGMALSGNWEFYWNTLLISDGKVASDRVPTAMQDTTKPWTSFVEGEKHPPVEGYASYRTVLQGIPAGEPIVVYIPGLAGAWRAYLNGEPVGESGVFPSGSTPAIASTFSTFTPFTTNGNDVELIIEAASKKRAGLYRPPVVMNANACHALLTRESSRFHLIFGAMLAICGIATLFYLCMDIQVYGSWVTIVLATVLLRFWLLCAPAGSFDSVFAGISYEDMDYFLLAAVYLGKFAMIGYMNQYFQLRISNGALWMFGIFFSFLYLLRVFVPNGIYAMYFERILPFATFMIDFLVASILYEKRRQKRSHLPIAVLQGLIFEAGAAIDLIYAEGLLTENMAWLTAWGSLLSSALFLWSYGRHVTLLYKDNEHIVKMREEVTQSNIRLLISQIRPHFLYNSLNAICALCRTDPQLAEKSIVQFSKYLKMNMKAIEKTEPVRFEEELVHIKSYVWIEQLRLDNRLQVKFDIQAEDFFIPILSVEPLVENAIRHGISKRSEGGTVTIRTYRDQWNYYVLVIDDGIGFENGETSKYNFQNLQSVGIKNVASRLEMMMNGSLEIESTKGVGTVATIRLPIEDNLTGPFELIYRTKDGELIRCIL